MKIFILVVIMATIIGGVIGGELTRTSFTVWGAAIGGIVTFVILMALGAYFERQEKKKVVLTPEMRGVFDRMLNSSTKMSSKTYPSIQDAVDDLIKDDLEIFANGGTPERRLIPHHAIKRAIILKAYDVDFHKLSDDVQAANDEDFQSKIYGIKRLDQYELDRIIEIMKTERTDLHELERQVRFETKMYSIVEPLFT